MDEIGVACCQLPLAVGELASNREAAAAAVEAAAAGGARVVVLPELASSGYAFEDRDEARRAAEPVLGPTAQGWIALARRLDVVVVGGICELGEKDELFNSSVIVDGSGVRAVHRKAHLWDRERLLFTPGDRPPPVVDTAAGRLSTMVCYDLEFPEFVRSAAKCGTELLCVPTNWPYRGVPADGRPMEVVRTQALASFNRIFVAACDRAAVERGVDWVGASVIVDPDGHIVAGPLTGPEPGVVEASCRLSQAADKALTPRNDVLADRRPELYHD